LLTVTIFPNIVQVIYTARLDPFIELPCSSQKLYSPKSQLEQTKERRASINPTNPSSTSLCPNANFEFVSKCEED
jgi:hypothetical protein